MNSDEYLVTREAKGVKREGFNKRELTLFRHSELVSESIPRRKLAVLAGKILKRVQDDSYDNPHNLLVTSCSLLVTGMQAKLAFTMAEILLSLTIIGVVAAITLPSLTGNINERTWNTQRKALYARFSQAIALMPSLNGYGTLTEGVDASGSTIITEDTATETFITNGLSKVLKINNICADDHLPDCGIPDKISTFGTSTITIPKKMSELNEVIVSTSLEASHSQIDTKVSAFETANGESIAVYYNPRCTTQLNLTNNGRSMKAQPAVCANFIYDLNGKKGPNAIGKDIGFMTALYSTDSVVVAPYPHAQDAATSVEVGSISSVCKSQDPDYRLPSKEELISLWVNEKLIGNLTQIRYWSASVNSSIDNPWYIRRTNGILSILIADCSLAVRCIKR